MCCLLLFLLLTPVRAHLLFHFPPCKRTKARSTTDERLLKLLLPHFDFKGHFINQCVRSIAMS
jgi:hypothetical protein